MITILKSIHSEPVSILEKICFQEDAWNLFQISSHLNSHYGFGFTTEGMLQGYCLFLDLDTDIELLRIGVHPTHRKKGIAQNLISHLFRCKKTILLEVNENNRPAISLYKSLGFSLIHKRKNYYQDNSTALIYSLSPANKARETI